jgi:hypothetical protein
MNPAIFFDQLASALRQRLNIIAHHELRDRDPAAHLKRLQEASEHIEHCVALLSRSEMDPQLRHYLERRSYEKALAWIEEKK